MQSKLRYLGYVLVVALIALLPRPASGQDWFRTAIGMDASKPRIAIADVAPRSDAAKSHATLFTQVVRDDLQYCGILELASPSFYPPQVVSVPAELKPPAWIEQPTNANYVGFGNLTEPAITRGITLISDLLR